MGRSAKAGTQDACRRQHNVPDTVLHARLEHAQMARQGMPARRSPAARRRLGRRLLPASGSACTAAHQAASLGRPSNTLDQPKCLGRISAGGGGVWGRAGLVCGVCA